MLVHTQRQDLVASSVRFLSVSYENYSTDQIINKFLSWVWICMSALQKFLQICSTRIALHKNLSPKESKRFCEHHHHIALSNQAGNLKEDFIPSLVRKIE